MHCSSPPADVDDWHFFFLLTSCSVDGFDMFVFLSVCLAVCSTSSSLSNTRTHTVCAVRVGKRLCLAHVISSPLYAGILSLFADERLWRGVFDWVGVGAALARSVDPAGAQGRADESLGAIDGEESGPDQRQGVPRGLEVGMFLRDTTVLLHRVLP